MRPLHSQPPDFSRGGLVPSGDFDKSSLRLKARGFHHPRKETLRLKKHPSKFRSLKTSATSFSVDCLRPKAPRSRDEAALATLRAEYRSSQEAVKAARTEHREAIEAETETGAPVVDDAEHRERLRLGSKAKVGGYLMARMQGRMPSGVEAEYSSGG